MFRRKWIKAFTCYMCSALKEEKYNGYYVIEIGTHWGEHKKVFVCEECMWKIVNDIREEKRTEGYVPKEDVESEEV